MIASEYSFAQKWLMAVRPPTLLLGLSPVIMGLSLGWYRLLMVEGLSFRWDYLAASVLAILLAILLQTAANLINDAKDAAYGVDHEERLGPPRVVQLGILSAAAVRQAYRLCFAFALAALLLLMWGRWDATILGVGGLCAAAAYLYTGGPYPLAYHGFGEFLALIFFGPIAVMGTSYLLLPELNWDAAAWGMGAGLLSASLMAINNFRDRNGDRKAGKHTLAIFLGGDKGRLVPLILALMGCFMLSFFAWMHTTWKISAAVSVLSVGVVGWGIYPLLSQGPARQNLALKRTALFTFVYAIVFAVLVWV